MGPPFYAKSLELSIVGLKLLGLLSCLAYSTNQRLLPPVPCNTLPDKTDTRAPPMRNTPRPSGAVGSSRHTLCWPWIFLMGLSLKAPSRETYPHSPAPQVISCPKPKPQDCHASLPQASDLGKTLQD